MAVIVSLHDVINEMDVFSDEHTAYINRKTVGGIGDVLELVE